MIPDHNLHRATPFKFLATMAALMAASAWLAMADRDTRAEDETHVLPTALGETRWHSSGPDTIPPELLGLPMASFQGKPLYAQGRVAREMRADFMIRIGDSDSGALGVYQFTGRDGKTSPELHLMAGIVPGEPGRGLFRPVGPDPKYAPRSELEPSSGAAPAPGQ